MHGKINTIMPVAMAVQNPLRSIPHCSGDDGIMMPGLIILVFLTGILPCLVILEGFRIRFPCEDVSAVLFIPQD